MTAPGPKPPATRFELQQTLNNESKRLYDKCWGPAPEAKAEAWVPAYAPADPAAVVLIRCDLCQWPGLGDPEEHVRANPTHTVSAYIKR